MEMKTLPTTHSILHSSIIPHFGITVVEVMEVTEVMDVINSLTMVPFMDMDMDMEDIGLHIMHTEDILQSTLIMHMEDILQLTLIITRESNLLSIPIKERNLQLIHMQKLMEKEVKMPQRRVHIILE